MDSCPGEPDFINLYALVTYLPNPLGSFLNSLRRQLVAGCHLRAHVTVLPPRKLISESAAWQQLQNESQEFSPIELELGDIEVFNGTNVIFLSIARGRQQLIELHDHLAQRNLKFDEPFLFHPHITLAQGLPADVVPAAAEQARKSWEEFQGSRRFLLESMTFVQSTASCEWVDLGEVALGVKALR